MNIQELEIKYAELGAEIERLKQQPEGVWEPKENEQYWRINSFGIPTPTRHCGNLTKANHNVYETEALANKASVLQRRANLIIQACLNFDPDFVPDWNDNYQRKFGFYYSYDRGAWGRTYQWIHGAVVVCVSSEIIADKVLAYLNSQEIK